MEKEIVYTETAPEPGSYSQANQAWKISFLLPDRHQKIRLTKQNRYTTSAKRNRPSEY